MPVEHAHVRNFVRIGLGHNKVTFVNKVQWCVKYAMNMVLSWPKNMSGEMTKGHLRQWIVNPNYIFFEKETHTELLTDNKLGGGGGGSLVNRSKVNIVLDKYMLDASKFSNWEWNAQLQATQHFRRCNKRETEEPDLETLSISRRHVKRNESRNCKMAAEIVRWNQPPRETWNGDSWQWLLIMKVVAAIYETCQWKMAQ